MTSYYVCFTQTFVIIFTVIETLAQIDHKYTSKYMYWYFLTFNVTFNVCRQFKITSRKLQDAIKLGRIQVAWSNGELCENGSYLTLNKTNQTIVEEINEN